jgi:hypothetical protein
MGIYIRSAHLIPYITAARTTAKAGHKRLMRQQGYFLLGLLLLDFSGALSSVLVAFGGDSSWS